MFITTQERQSADSFLGSLPMRFIPVSALGLAAFILAGCAANPMRQYDSELRETVGLVRQGSVKQALSLVDKNNEGNALSKEKDILYYLEKGELLALDNDYPGSRDTWLKADEFVRTWEDAVRSDPSKVIGDIGSFVINDKTRRYEGQDYEKVMLSANLTLSHILQGNYDLARIEMKKTYEREKLIESFREKEYDKIRDEAEQNKVSVNVAQMRDYPMAEIDTPEVNRLKNGYQNAFAHYLAGYFFEVTGERSLAEPGYRNAVQLAPNSRLAQEGLKDLGRRRPGTGQTDVLFVVESGFAPSWKSITVPIPLPNSKGGIMVTPLSFPYVKAENRGAVPANLLIAGKAYPVDTLSNLDTMARRQLKDQMPGILLRSSVRAVLKSLVQDQAYKGGLALGILANVGTVVTEQADDRNWRTLPESISVARAMLPPGNQTIEIATDRGTSRHEVTIGNRFTIIPIRLTGGAVYVGQPSVLGAGLPEPAPEPKKPARAPARKPVSKTP